MADRQEITKPVAEAPPIPTDADLQRTREKIAETASRIEQRVREDLDWKSWVRRYPLRAVGVAAAAGVLAGIAVGGRRRGANEAIVREVGKQSLVATVLTAVATAAVREGAKIVAERLLSNGEKP